MMRRAWFAACAMLLACGASRAGEAAAPQPAHGLIVKLRNAPDHKQILAVRDTAAGERARVQRVLAEAGAGDLPFRAVGRAFQLVASDRILSGAQAAALADQLRQRPDVEWVEPNVRERRLNAPTDPFYAATAGSTGQWWMFPHAGTNANAISARLRGVPGLQSAWSIATGSPAAVVAVLDTGITAHPDLDAHVLPGYDFVSQVEYANDGSGRDADPSDPGDWVSAADKTASPTLFGSCEPDNSSWHGTSIAGMVAAVTDNGVGVAGINRDGRVLPVRVAGKCGAEVADIIDGMRWAAGLSVTGVPANANPARIINISFGGSSACGSAYQATVDELRNAGAVVVAAAGNERTAPTRPANCSGVIGVAALNRDGFKASYSNFGAGLTVSTVGGDPVDVGAWGALLGDEGLLTTSDFGRTVPGGASYGNEFGTSFSAPIAAGVISLMLSVNPSLTPAQIIAGLQASARPHVQAAKLPACSNDHPGRCTCSTATCGAGILDAEQALVYALSPQSYVAPVRPAETIDTVELNQASALGTPDQPANPPAAATDSGGGGGGALGLGWLLAMGLAVRVLARQPR